MSITIIFNPQNEIYGAVILNSYRIRRRQCVTVTLFCYIAHHWGQIFCWYQAASLSGFRSIVCGTVLLHTLWGSPFASCLNENDIKLRCKSTKFQGLKLVKDVTSRMDWCAAKLFPVLSTFCMFWGFFPPLFLFSLSLHSVCFFPHSLYFFSHTCD